MPRCCGLTQNRSGESVVLGHREDAGLIGADDQLRREIDGERIGFAGHERNMEHVVTADNA